VGSGWMPALVTAASIQSCTAPRPTRQARVLCLSFVSGEDGRLEGREQLGDFREA
jgi:hypothetical protein